MGGAVFPPCCLTWDQTMVKVVKIIATSFKSTWAPTVVFSAPDPTAGHCWPMPPLETPGHSQASLGQSLLESLLLTPGFWCTQSFVYALQESVSPVLWKSCNEILWTFKVRFLAILSPLLDPQVGKSAVGLRTFMAVWEILWCNCSQVCESPTPVLYWD